MGHFLKPISIIVLLGANLGLFAMDDAFHCKVPAKTMSSQPQSAGTTQAELDARQFAREQESKRKSAIKNKLSQITQEERPLCKTAVLCRNLPEELQNQICSNLNKKFNKVRSFKAYDGPIVDLATHTKADGTQYLLMVTNDGTVLKVDGSTGEAVFTFHDLSNGALQHFSAVTTHVQSDGSWFIIVGSRQGHINIYNGETNALVKIIINVLPRHHMVFPVEKLSTGTTADGNWFIFVNSGNAGNILVVSDIEHLNIGFAHTEPEFVGSSKNNDIRVAFVTPDDPNILKIFEGSLTHNNSRERRYRLLEPIKCPRRAHIDPQGVHHVIYQTQSGEIDILKIDNEDAVSRTRVENALQGLGDSPSCSVATFNKGSSWFIAFRTLAHDIKIYNGVTGALEQTIPHFTNNPMLPLPITTAVQPNGDVELILSDDDGKITIFSQGSTEFEQELTGNRLPELARPVVINNEQPAEQEEIAQPTTTSLLKKLTIAGIAAGIGAAFLKLVAK